MSLPRGERRREAVPRYLTRSSRFHADVPGLRRWLVFPRRDAGLEVVATWPAALSVPLRQVAEMASDLAELLDGVPLLGPPLDGRDIDLVAPHRRTLIVEDGGWGIVTTLYKVWGEAS